MPVARCRRNATACRWRLKRARSATRPEAFRRRRPLPIKLEERVSIFIRQEIHRTEPSKEKKCLQR
jgi:hypothetical protein